MLNFVWLQLYILYLLEDRTQADTVLQITNSSKTDSISIQFSLKYAVRNKSLLFYFSKAHFKEQNVKKKNVLNLEWTA